jgi:hypothetical protein
MSSSTRYLYLSLATVLATSSVHALPDKQADRSGWIKASMEGKQAPFCGVPAAKLPGASDPDFAINQIGKQWDGADANAIKLDDAVPLANAICKFPGNPDVQRALMPRWQTFVKRYELGAADFADFAAIQNPARTTIAEPAVQENVRFADVDARTQAAVAKRLLVTSYGMEFMSYAEILDATPTASEHLRLAFVEKCMDGASLARWAICKGDARGLDRKRFDQELAAAKIDPRHRLQAKLRFVNVQHQVNERAAKYDAEAKKDDGVAKAIDAIPTAAATKWREESAPQQAALAWTYKLVDEARANNKKLMNGCDDELLTHLSAYLKAKAPATTDDLKAAFKDNLGSQLGSAAALCVVRNEAAHQHWNALSSGFAHRWGVRTMTWHALASTKIEFDTKRGNDPLGLPKPVILYANGTASSSHGTIATLKETGDAIELTFKKETWTENVCTAWKETDKIDSYDPKANKFIYRTVCVKTGTETRSSTAQPVTIEKRHAAGLKVGVAASFVRNSDGTGYPTAVYADAKRSKLVGAFGVMY